jgi:tyrosine-protein kinase Etk/Wzc
MSEEIKDRASENDNDKEGINLLDYLIILAKRIKLVIVLTLSAAIITAVYAFFLPNIYVTEAKILPPRGENWRVQAELARNFGGFVGLGNDMFGGSQILYVELLKSNYLFDRIVKRFDLINRYEDNLKNRLFKTIGLTSRDKRDKDDEFKKKIEAREDLKDMVSFSPDSRRKRKSSLSPLDILTQDSPLITITVRDKDTELAANIANAFIDELNNRLQELAVSDAAQRRLFFEKQVKQAREALLQSEEAMKEFQEKTGALKVEAQAGAVLEGIAKLRAEIAAKEVELSVMKTYSTLINPDLQKVSDTIKGLKTELSKLEQKGGSNPDPMITTGKMPSLSIDYARRLRELRYNESLFEAMAKQYEMAKIDEAKDPVSVQVIDKAEPLNRKVGPLRRQMVMKNTVTTFFFSIFLAFLLEFFERWQAKSSKNRELVDTLKGYLPFRRKS